MRVVIYEDNYEDFYPLINLYPQFDLRVGMKSVAENTVHYFPRAKVDYIARDNFRFKRIKPSELTLYLSARFIMNKKIILPKKESKIMIKSNVVGFIKKDSPFPKTLNEIRPALKKIKKSVKADGFVLNNLWDLIRYNEPMLHLHLKMRSDTSRSLKRVCVIGSKKAIHVAKDARIFEFVTLDVSDGPIFIDRRAVIKPFSTIVGPSYIGPDTIVDRAKITKSSIGPVCRLGGEIDACLFQGYTNKYHGGFIGHSFIGEWVNIGALATNSDLKNNYGPVRLKIGKKRLNSGMAKLGCFVGDHTKLGIGTLIPTGAVIGNFVNFFGGGMMPNYVASFCWLTRDTQKDYRLSEVLKTAKIMMKRRDIKMSRRYENLVREAYKCRNL
jgi:UDP-N-acetylglucosamine diphosphorylase/glucosamine-1-phosphate N-acetyltransferase